MDTDRIQRVKASLRRARLDALVLRLPENVVMAFGAWPLNGFSYGLFTAEDGPVQLVAPSCEDEEMEGCWAQDIRHFIWPRLVMDDPQQVICRELQRAARSHGLHRARIGYEGSFESVAPAHNSGEVLVPCESSIAWLKSVLPSAKWMDATELLHSQRARKTEPEIARLRIAHQVADCGLRAFARAVRPGVSEAELGGIAYAACLAKGIQRRGVRHVNVYPQVSSGPNAHRAWRPIVSTGKRRLRDGELALLEMAVCVDGFWADVTRVNIAGRASTVQKEAFAAVAAAQSAAIKIMRPGVTASRVHETATRILCEAGFADSIVHLTGHGVGFRYHEPVPMLAPGSAKRLQQGNVSSVEPGLYNPAWGGIRLEDNVVVTTEGVEVLTKADKCL